MAHFRKDREPEAPLQEGAASAGEATRQKTFLEERAPARGAETALSAERKGGASRVPNPV